MPAEPAITDFQIQPFAVRGPCTLTGQLVRGHLALRHHQVMRLMMSALNHYSHEAEGVELDGFFRIDGDHGQSNTVRQIVSLSVPTKFHEFADVRRNHALDGVQRPAFARYRYFRSRYRGYVRR